MSLNLNQAVIDQLRQGIGEQVRSIVNGTAGETIDADLNHAVDLLHTRLNALDGMTLDRDWSRNALETLRRGDDLVIQIG